jgi:hypothetical protein
MDYKAIIRQKCLSQMPDNNIGLYSQDNFPQEKELNLKRCWLHFNVWFRNVG